MSFRFTPEADAELTEARQWYSHHRKDLDLKFMQCIEHTLSQIQFNPRLFPVVMEASGVLSFAPFVIFYEVTEDEIKIIAVYHSRRNPEVWKSRVS